MSRSLAAAAVSALLVAAVPTAAADAKTLRGRTSQGRPASLITDANGVPTRIRVAWRARCKKPGFRVSDSTVFSPPFDAASPDAVSDAGTYRIRLRGGGRGRITGELTANRAGERWTGTYRVRAVYSRRGKVTHVCQSRRITWSVR